MQGALGRLLEAEGFLDSSFLAVRALDMVGHVQEPRALEPGRRLGAEVAEALPEPRRPCMMEGEAARGTVQESPLRC